jgi:spore germination cell wall hydrolase CwlJ-like protein
MEGKSAVAQVVLNRMDDKRFPSDVCGVVYQITGKVHQFSWTIKKDKEISDMDMWKDSLDVARNAILNNEAHTELKKSKALFYHATYVKPQWHKIIVAKIGRHIFYS